MLYVFWKILNSFWTPVWFRHVCVYSRSHMVVFILKTDRGTGRTTDLILLFTKQGEQRMHLFLPLTFRPTFFLTVSSILSSSCCVQCVCGLTDIKVCCRSCIISISDLWSDRKNNNNSKMMQPRCYSLAIVENGGQEVRHMLFPVTILFSSVHRTLSPFVITSQNKILLISLICSFFKASHIIFNRNNQKQMQAIIL